MRYRRRELPSERRFHSNGLPVTGRFRMVQFCSTSERFLLQKAFGLVPSIMFEQEVSTT